MKTTRQKYAAIKLTVSKSQFCIYTTLIYKLMSLCFNRPYIHVHTCILASFESHFRPRAPFGVAILTVWNLHLWLSTYISIFFRFEQQPILAIRTESLNWFLETSQNLITVAGHGKGGRGVTHTLLAWKRYYRAHIYYQYFNMLRTHRIFPEHESCVSCRSYIRVKRASEA